VVELRHASAADADAVLAVWAEADAEPTVTDDAWGIVALIEHAHDALLLAVDEERVVGTLIVGWDGWRGGFYRLAVVPDRRREGIARRLVEAGERQLIGRGARRLAVFAVTGSPGAVDFWESVGYRSQSDRTRLVKNVEGA